MKKLTNQSGFTLIELVAVISILIILTALTVPNVLKAIKNSERTISKDKQKAICDAASVYVEINSDEFYRLNYTNGYEHISLQQLKDSGYVKEQIDSLQKEKDYDLAKTYMKLTKQANGEIVCDNKYSVLDDNPGTLAGTGTSADPYQISSIEDLMKWATDSQTNNYAGKYVVLTRDLDFKDDGSYGDVQNKTFGDINKDGTTKGIKAELLSGTGFPGIKFFAGTFDGQDRVIKNLYINNPTTIAGFFIALTGSVHDLGMSNVSIVGKDNVAAIAANVEITAAQTFQNNYLEGGTIKGNAHVGGLLGRVVGPLTVTSCYSNATIEVSDNGVSSYYYGGLVGGMTSAAVQNSYASGKLTVKNTNGTGIGGVTGGLVGININGTIKNSYANVSLTDENAVKSLGGLVGTENGATSTVINSFASGTIHSAKTSIYNGLLVGSMDNGATLIDNSFGYSNGCTVCGNTLAPQITLADLQSEDFFTTTLNWKNFEIKKEYYPRVYKNNTQIILGKQLRKKVP